MDRQDAQKRLQLNQSLDVARDGSPSMLLGMVRGMVREVEPEGMVSEVEPKTIDCGKDNMRTPSVEVRKCLLRKVSPIRDS